MAQIFLILVILTGFCQTARAAEIIFRQTAEVSGPDIRLGDVADFDEESDLTAALASQTVGPAPPPGESVVLHSQTVKHSLVSTKSVPEDIAWSGSPAIMVNRQGITVGPDKILTIIAEYIDEQKKNLPEAEIQFIPASLPLPFILPTGELTSEVIPSNPGILGSSRFSLILRVDNQVAKNMSIRGRIEANANIVVTARAVKKDSILSPQLLTMAVTDISEMAGPQFEASDLTGKKLTRSLKAGSPVLANMVESLPVVRRGEKVKIVINSGQLHVSATGFAFTDGKLDETIRVQNLSSNKLIYGRVAAPGLVEVML
jgi:flagella basal body P-ring formation protein FlgA